MAGTTCCGQEQYEQNQRPTGDRRVQLIDQIKRIVGDLENEGKRKPKPINKNPGARIPAGLRDMEDECRQYWKRRECSPPTITSIALHEIRPTSDYSNLQHESSSQVTYMDATKQSGYNLNPVPSAPWELPRTPSQELRASTLYRDCECTKRNGLQQDCPRWDCGGRPECLATSPGPCCGPSQARKPIRGDRRVSVQSAAEGVSRQSPPPDLDLDFCKCEELQQKTPTQAASPGVGVVRLKRHVVPLRLQPQQLTGGPKAMVCFCEYTGGPQGGQQHEMMTHPPTHQQAMGGPAAVVCFCEYTRGLHPVPQPS